MYVTKGMLLSRAHELLSRAHELLSRKTLSTYMNVV